MKSAVIIPSRWSSSRFPGKPLAEIAGKSLIRHVFERASGSSADRVVIATDDARIRDAAEGFGAEALMTPVDLATGTDRVAEALSLLPDRDEIDVVINVQGDEPLIEPALIDRMISTLRESDAEIVTLSCPLTEEEIGREDVVKVVSDRSGHALYFSRSPIPHGDHSLARRHIGIYGFMVGALDAFASLDPTPLEKSERLEQLRLLENGFKIALLETDEPHLGVDRPEDVSRVEAAIQRADE